MPAVPDLFALDPTCGAPHGRRRNRPAVAPADVTGVKMSEPAPMPPLAAVPQTGTEVFSLPAHSVVKQMPPPGAAKKSQGLGAKLAKPGVALMMRTAEGEENLTPFRSLDDLLSAVKPILRAAARSPDAGVVLHPAGRPGFVGQRCGLTGASRPRSHQDAGRAAPSPCRSMSRPRSSAGSRTEIAAVIADAAMTKWSPYGAWFGSLIHGEDFAVAPSPNPLPEGEGLLRREGVAGRRLRLPCRPFRAWRRAWRPFRPFGWSSRPPCRFRRRCPVSLVSCSFIPSALA